MEQTQTPTSETQRPTQTKKYRAQIYDIYDQQYADILLPYIREHAVFDFFADKLSEETHINRYKLLDAIDDYNKTEMSESHPLSIRFTDNAFNVRPEQKCTIS